MTIDNNADVQIAKANAMDQNVSLAQLKFKQHTKEKHLGASVHLLDKCCGRTVADVPRKDVLHVIQNQQAISTIAQTVTGAWCLEEKMLSHATHSNKPGEPVNAVECLRGTSLFKEDTKKAKSVIPGAVN